LEEYLNVPSKTPTLFSPVRTMHSVSIALAPSYHNRGPSTQYPVHSTHSPGPSNTNPSLRPDVWHNPCYYLGLIVRELGSESRRAFCCWAV